jgi:tetratricopeptide (TPR) repeat protein
LLINTIRFEGAKQDLHFLDKLENELSAEGRGIPRYYYAIAASLAIFVLVGIFYPFGKSSYPEVYAEYFKPYANLFEPTVRGNAGTNKRSEGFSAYENGDYQKAITVFSDLLKEKKDPGIMLLSANANLALGRTDNAEGILQDLISSFDELDIQGKWYLALCYLRNEQKDKSIKVLQELATTDSSYASKAKALLEKIE